MSSISVLYMSMSLDGYIAGPNDEPGNPGGDGFMRLHEWYGFEASPPSIGTEPIELEKIRLIEDPGVTHFRFRVVK
jgi:hypothetical protein